MRLRTLIVVALLVCAGWANASVMSLWFKPRAAASTTTPWTPSNITTAVWLDGAQFNYGGVTGALISTWTDLSGNGRHATQTGVHRPKGYSEGSLGYAYFSPPPHATNFFALPNAAMPVKEFTLLGLIHPEPSTSSKTILARAYNFGALYFIITTNNLFRAVVNDIAVSSTSGVNTSRSSILCAKYNGTNLVIWIDGVQVGTTNATGNINYHANDAAAIGAFLNTSGTPASTFYGAMRELVMIHSAQSTAAQQQAEGYLAWRWGIQTSLPSDHPYRYVRP